MFNREATKAALLAAADVGKMNGMRAAVEILRALAKGRRRVDASELIAAALTMEAACNRMEERANKTMTAPADAKDATAE